MAPRMVLCKDATAFSLCQASRPRAWLTMTKTQTDTYRVEPLFKVGVVAENVGQQEVEQRPELVEIILQGRARDEDAEFGRKFHAERRCQL